VQAACDAHQSAAAAAAIPTLKPLDKTMKMKVLSTLLLVVLCLIHARAFTTQFGKTRSHSSPVGQVVVLHEAALPSETDADGPPPPNLVDKNTFLAAVDSLNSELAKQQSESQSSSDDGNAIEQPPAPMSLAAQEDGETFFAIGKLIVNLNVESGAPGMDLAESQEGLVLVSGVAGAALEAGIQTGDTIVGVSVAAADTSQETRGYSLEDTARVLMGAMRLALEHESNEIELELNRLLKMRYA